MTRRSAVTALADVTATLVDDYDVVSVLTALARSCAEVVGRGAAGILVVGAGAAQATRGSEDLELLAASSHEVGEMEMFQVQLGEGPCIDAIHTDAVVTATSAAEMTQRWPRMGAALTGSGFSSVHAVPLRWRGAAFGALNVFLVEPRALTEEEVAASRAFADVATLGIVHARRHEIGQIGQELQEALDGRIVVEQAKGVLAVQEGVSPGTAFDLLLRRAEDEATSLAAMARQVVERAERGTRWAGSV